jgi:type II secretory pathway component GspD/PulD (secretin)
MAVTLTEAEKLDIAKILTTPGKIITYIDVNDQVTNLGEAYITAAVETDIRALITEWGTISRTPFSVEPKDRNFGVRVNSEAGRDGIRQEMASLLYFTNLSFGGQGWARSTRG